MTSLEFYYFVFDYVAPAGLALVVVLLVYVEVTEALRAHRRAKREREQQIH